jgi:hypothetical protein
MVVNSKLLAVAVVVVEAHLVKVAVVLVISPFKPSTVKAHLATQVHGVKETLVALVTFQETTTLFQATWALVTSKAHRLPLRLHLLLQHLRLLVLLLLVLLLNH